LQIPFYLRTTIILLGLVIFFYIVYIGQAILLPLVFSAILALVLHPVAKKLEKKKCPRLLSSLICVLIALLFVGLIIYLLTTQLVSFTDALPALQQKLIDYFVQLQQYLDTKFNLSTTNPLAWLNKNIENIIRNSGDFITGTLGWFTNTAVVLSLVPIYIFLWLFYRGLLVNFLIEVFTSDKNNRVNHIIFDIKEVLQKYIQGLLIECGIVGLLQGIALAVIGIDYAILFGVLGGLLNVIPYIGSIVSVLLPLLLALVTTDNFTYPIAVIVCYIVIQFIDNNFLVPYIVASNVKINAIISLVAVLFGEAISGVPGMFLAIPAVAILKIIFDSIPSLNPWGRLLGDELPGSKKKVKKPLPLVLTRKKKAKLSD
jgi:predicted PurR-regulated permease PerM